MSDNATCKSCLFWKALGRRLNSNDSLVKVGLCKNKISLNYKYKTEEQEFCEDIKYEQSRDPQKIK